jgi:hypothetical protein
VTRRLCPRRLFCTAFLAPIFFAVLACHSYHIDATIENRTGAPIQLLEIDYPSASFGINRLEAGAIYRYRFQIRGSDTLKVEYSTPDGHQVQIVGPTLAERQQGQLQIILLPGGKADFVPRLNRNP